MNRQYLTIGSLAVISLFVAGLSVFGQECPRGLINDPAPGSCGLYNDRNNNGICDLSETAKATESSGGEISSQTENGNLPFEVGDNEAKKSADYHILEIVLLTTAAYFFSLAAVKKNILTAARNRALWNIILLFSFIATAATSILFLLRTDYDIVIGSLSEISFWHIEFGLIMVTVSIFHALWHIAYYRNIPKK